MRATDAAYQILKKRGEPMEVQDLLDEVLATLGLDRDGRHVAQIYTELNLDVRFHYRGNKDWGLREWASRGSAKATGGRERAGHDADDSEEPDEDAWQ